MRYLILLIATLLFSSDIIIQYQNIKKEYYRNQIIDLKIKIITPKEMNLSFIPPTNSEINTTRQNRFVYLLDLKYKNDDYKKSLFVIGKNFYKQIILNNLYTTKKLEHIKDFCNVLAEKMLLKNIIASRYNDKYNMISFTIIAQNANLKDFSLSLKDENLTVNTPYKKATYLGLIEKKHKFLKFYYFNTKNDNYEKITAPVNLKEETISTQTNLNPEENTLFTPFNILLLSLCAFFIIVFLVYQRIWLLIFPVMITAFLIYKNLPKGETYLARGTKIYILPTRNSTVFYIAPVGTKVKILKKKTKYTKIKIDNKIGWVKNEDIK
jgi:hypothetical protein